MVAGKHQGGMVHDRSLASSDMEAAIYQTRDLRKVSPHDSSITRLTFFRMDSESLCFLEFLLDGKIESTQFIRKTGPENYTTSVQK